MTRGERTRDGSRSRSRAESAVLPFPRSRRSARLELDRLAPSGRSIALAIALVLVGAGLYAIARTTSAFAVRNVVVTGAPPSVASDVRAALGAATGQSLVTLDVERQVESVPTVAAVRFDRAFPHTLRVFVVPEQPVAVARQGASSWLVSARGRVLASLTHGARPGLPRLWLGPTTKVVPGGMLGADASLAVRALRPAAAAGLPDRVASARATNDEIMLRLRSGLEVRLGDASQLPLKLAVTAHVLPLLVAGTTYLDVAVPDRPVAGQTLESQVEVKAQDSTTASGSG